MRFLCLLICTLFMTTCVASSRLWENQEPRQNRRLPRQPHRGIVLLARALGLAEDSAELAPIRAHTARIQGNTCPYYANCIAGAVGYYIHQAYTPHHPGQDTLPQRLNMAQDLLLTLENMDRRHRPLFTPIPMGIAWTAPHWASMYLVNTYLQGFSYDDHMRALPSILGLFGEIDQNYTTILAGASWAWAFFDPQLHSIGTFVDLTRICCHHLNQNQGQPNHLRDAVDTFHEQGWDPVESVARLGAFLQARRLGPIQMLADHRQQAY